MRMPVTPVVIQRDKRLYLQGHGLWGDLQAAIIFTSHVEAKDILASSIEACPECEHRLVPIKLSLQEKTND